MRKEGSFEDTSWVQVGIWGIIFYWVIALSLILVRKKGRLGFLYLLVFDSNLSCIVVQRCKNVFVFMKQNCLMKDFFFRIYICVCIEVLVFDKLGSIFFRMIFHLPSFVYYGMMSFHWFSRIFQDKGKNILTILKWCLIAFKFRINSKFRK